MRIQHLTPLLFALLPACSPANEPPQNPVATTSPSANTPAAPSSAAPTSTAPEPVASTASTASTLPDPGLPPPQEPQDPSASIGSATMKPDGTIMLMLRAEGPGPTIGDALLSYPTTHPDYKNVLKHVGPLKPGESKPVKPFPATWK